MKRDKAIFELIEKERHRQEEGIELIASENFTSPQVMKAQGSVLTNKYAEGLPGKRYYGGCEYVDVAEQLAIDDQQRLVVVFPAKYTSSRTFCERPERRQQIEKAVAQLVGRHVQVVFQLGEDASPQSLDATRSRSGVSPWERLQQAARHPLIRRAAELFDARPTRIEETGR